MVDKGFLVGAIIVFTLIGEMFGLIGYYYIVINPEYNSICEEEGYDEYFSAKSVGGQTYIECVKYDLADNQLVKAWFPLHKGG